VKLSKQLFIALKRNQYEGQVFVTELTEKDYTKLYEFGIENILLPQQIAAYNFYNSYLKDKIVY
jgi:hypothetical protein